MDSPPPSPPFILHGTPVYNFPYLPKYFSLYIRTSRQTLLKAFDKTRKTPVTSNDANNGDASKVYRVLFKVTDARKSHTGENQTP